MFAYLGEGYEPGTLDAFRTNVRRVMRHAFLRDAFAPDALGFVIFLASSRLDISQSKAAQVHSAAMFTMLLQGKVPVTRTLAAHTRCLAIHHYLAMHKPRAVRHDRRCA